MRRTVFDDDHEAFRATVRDFLAREVVPIFPAWEKAGAAPRDFYRRLGKLGVLGLQVPEEYGGGGQRGFRFNVVVNEELARAKLGLGPVRVHTDIVLPYLLRYASEEQKRRWLPGVANGELMTAIAMTEPGTGSVIAIAVISSPLATPGSQRRFCSSEA